MRPRALDHVALWVADRDELAEFACAHLGMHVIERTDAFTLVGADARQGKLTLFAADGPREPGVLERVVLRVGDLERALADLPSELSVTRNGDVAELQGPQRLGLGLTQGEGLDYDLDHVVVAVPDAERTSRELERLGFAREDGRLAVGDKYLRLREDPSAREGESPLLNHLALLVDSAQEHLEEAERLGMEVDEFRDAPNTLAVFVWGPDRIKLEYVEHKPTFSLV